MTTAEPMQPWIPITDLRTCAILNKLGEELNELGKVLNRCLMQGMDGIDPKSGEVNGENLPVEMADVMGLIAATVGEFRYDYHQRARMDRRADQKQANAEAWLELIAPLPKPADNTDYDIWIAKGKELYALYGGDRDGPGLAAWHGWSADAHNYDPDALEQKWAAFADQPADEGDGDCTYD